MDKKYKKYKKKYLECARLLEEKHDECTKLLTDKAKLLYERKELVKRLQAKNDKKLIHRKLINNKSTQKPCPFNDTDTDTDSENVVPIVLFSSDIKEQLGPLYYIFIFILTICLCGGGIFVFDRIMEFRNKLKI